MSLENYIIYITYLNKKLNGFFEKQYPYIRCKKGCAKCCKNGEYPFSALEFDFLMIGFSRLPSGLQDEILSKIRHLKEEKQKQNKETFIYECPFLLEDECCVYDFRGIICRSFGLIAINEHGNSKIPFCAFEGLNYANVLDVDTKIISSEKYKKLGDVPQPLAFNVSYDFLTSETIANNFKLDFGEKKPLIDWFK